MRLIVFLAVFVMLSASALVTVRFNSRELFVASERLKSQAIELDQEWRRLQLEQAELSSNSRVNSIAHSKLGLEPIISDKTLYIQESNLRPLVGAQP